MSDCKHERTWLVRGWMAGANGDLELGVADVCRGCGALRFDGQQVWDEIPPYWWRGWRYELLPPHPAVTEVPSGYALVRARALGDERANAAALHDLVELALDGGTMGPGWEEAARQALAGTAGVALLQERASWGETFRELGAKLEAARAAKEEAEAGARSLAARLAVLLAERDADREAVRTLVQTLNGSLYVPTAVVEPLATLHARMAIWEEPATPLARAPDAGCNAPDDHEVDPMHAVAEDERGTCDEARAEIDRRIAAVKRIAWLEPPIVAGPALAEEEEPSAGDVLEAR